MSHLTLIYNPVAGRIHRKPALVQLVAGWLSPMGEVRLVATTGPKTAGPLAVAALENGSIAVIAFGGDGTVNEVANGLVGSSVPLGIIPGGTANVLCVETGIGTNPEKAARRLASDCKPVRIAVGQMLGSEGNCRYFLAMAGVGLDAIVVTKVNPVWKQRIGKGAYWISGFGMFGRNLPEFDVQVSGVSSRRSFLLISRIRNYGGDLEIARSVSLLETCFETVAFAGANSLRYLPYLGGVITGLLGRMPGVRVAPAMELHCRPAGAGLVPVQLDGELAGVLPADFRVVPDALTLLIPEKYVRRATEQRWITSPIV